MQLPDWFEALNADCRYQLTVIGAICPAIVAEKINHRFTIRTSVLGTEISRQITAVRQDAYAKADPLVVEQHKERSCKASTSILSSREHHRRSRLSGRVILSS